METRNLKMIFTKGGSGSVSTKTSIPSTWVKELGLTEDNREITAFFDGERIVIEKSIIRDFDFYKEHFKKELENCNKVQSAFLGDMFNKTLDEHYFNKYDLDSLEHYPEVFELDFCKITLNEKENYLKIEKDNKCIEYAENSYIRLYNEFKNDLFIKYCNCDFIEYIVLKTYYEF